jgi:hypothetical protein
VRHFKAAKRLRLFFITFAVYLLSFGNQFCLGRRVVHGKERVQNLSSREYFLCTTAGAGIKHYHLSPFFFAPVPSSMHPIAFPPLLGCTRYALCLGIDIKSFCDFITQRKYDELKLKHVCVRFASAQRPSPT